MPLIGNYTVTTSFKCMEGQTASGPFLLPAGFNDSSLADLQLYIPAVSPPSPPASGCTIGLDGNNNDFSLSWETIQNVLYAKVTVRKDNLYVMENRPKLLASFLAFKQQLESIETSGCLIDGGAALVANRVACALPLLFTEILSYTYGFDAANRYADILPGMRLTVHHGSYQYVAPNNFPGGNRNAYTGGAAVSLDVKRRLDGMLAFNAYAGEVRYWDMGTPQPFEIANIMDLMATGSGRKYLRLIYPPQMDNVLNIASAPTAGRNVALIGANTLADLNAATDAYVNSGGIAGATSVCMFFSGRVAAFPEIMVMVNGQATWVPVGTTVQDVVEQCNDSSPLERTAKANRPNVMRWCQPSLVKPNTGSQTAYALMQVTFEPQTTVKTPLNQWQLPLVKGDRVSTYP